MSELLDWAEKYNLAGLSVIPTTLGSKKPALKWEVYQYERSSGEQLFDWFDDGFHGVGLVCGAISGGLVVLDFDEEAETSYQKLVEAVPEIVPYLPLVKTGKGYHLYVRLPFEVRNVVLAQTAAGGVFIETRGEGGYVIAPPTVHPSGAVYEWVNGFFTIPKLTVRQGYKLLGACVQLHQGREPTLKITKKKPRAKQKPTKERVYQYAQGALKRIGEELAQAGQGQRNTTLNRLAFNLGRFVGAGLLTEPEVMEVLRQACIENGLINEDGELSFERTAQNGLSAGVKLAWTMEELESRLG